MKLVFFETPLFSHLLPDYLTHDHQIWLFTLYDKDEAVDLTPKEKKALKQAIQAELIARR